MYADLNKVIRTAYDQSHQVEQLRTSDGLRMLQRATQADPLKALISLEFAALALSFAIDMLLAATHVNGAPSDPRSLALYAATFLTATVAVSFVPHRPNRRYALVAVSIAVITAANLLPTGAISPIVLLIVLCARLTFAFGLTGTVIAWLSAFSIFLADAIITFLTKPAAHIADLAATVVSLTLLLTLLFGLFAIMWLYARRGAVEAAASERTRIALDLHDSLGHSLTTLSVHLQNASALVGSDNERATQYLSRASTLADDVLEDVRESVTILHDDAVSAETGSTNQLLDRLRSDFSAAHNIRLQWDVRMAIEPQGRSAIVLYRILQEALTNAARHSRAQHIHVVVRSDNTNVELMVEDNGCGFERSAYERGHGLVSMQSRVDSLSGRLAISSHAGTGTRVHATFPVIDVS